MSEDRALTIHQSPHLMPAMTLADAAERFKALTTFTRSIMRDGIDYGKVPGTDKPTLLKPGAEKLTTFFGLTTRFELIEKEEDWTGATHGGEPFFYYWYRCQLWRGDMLIAEADGSCNSWETRYRYRRGERKCPTCGQETIIQGKPQYGGGWICWKGKGGCGAKFQATDPRITSQEVGRILNPNPADVVNTVVKISQKRALVATTLLAVNASEFFTQDLEDLDLSAIDVEFVDVTPAPAPEIPQKAATATNGYVEHQNGNGINSPGSLLTAVNEVTAGYYNAVPHMLHTLRKVTNDSKYQWPVADNVGGYLEAYGLLVEYAKAQVDQREVQ